jgi:cyclic dehypoxanthinyl futalosine synthase
LWQKKEKYMQVHSLLERALKFEFLSAAEGEFLFKNASTAELMYVGNELRKIKKQNSNKVTWIIDRNLKYHQCLYCQL